MDSDLGRRENRKLNYDPRAKNSFLRRSKKEENEERLKKKVLVKKRKGSVMGMKSSGESVRPHVIVKRLGLAAEVVPFIPEEERQNTEEGDLHVLFVPQGMVRQNRGKTGAKRRKNRGWNRRQRFLESPRRAERRQDAERERSTRRRSGQDESELPTTRLLGKVKVGKVARRGRMLRSRRVGRRRKRKSWYQTTFL